MKKSILFLATLLLSFTAQAAVVNAHPNGGEDGVLSWFFAQAAAGDTVLLADGEYVQSYSLDLKTDDLVIMAAEGAKPVIKASSYLKIHATTTFKGITFDGLNTATYAVGSRGTEEKNLTLKNCEFKNFKESNICIYENTTLTTLDIDSCVFDGTSTTPVAIYGQGIVTQTTIQDSEFKNYTEYCIYANDYYGARFDKLTIDNCLFHDCTYSAVYLADAEDGLEKQSCSDFTLTNSTIYNVGDNPEGEDVPQRAVVEIRKNSSVASEQKVLIDHITIYNFPALAHCGAFKVDQTNNTTISNCIAMNPDNIYSKWINPFVISAGATISNSVYFNCGYLDNGATQSNLVKADPMFVDAANADFMLYAESPAVGMGDPRWGVKAGIQPGEGKLKAAVDAAEDGATIILGDETYEVSTSIEFNKEGLTIVAAEGTKPVIKLVDEGGNSSLKLSATTTFNGITFDGNNITKFPVTSTGTDANQFTFVNCEFKNYTKWAITNEYRSSHVDNVIIDKCLFHDGGSAVYFNSNGYNGQHSCSYFKMTNTTIYNINYDDWGVGVIHVSANGDATGEQNEVEIDHITMYNVSTKEYGAITVRKSSKLSVTNSIIANPASNSDKYAFYIYGGNVTNTLYYNSKVNSEAPTMTTINKDPLFVDATNANFKLMPLSPARGAATDGNDLGDPRWYTPLTKYIVTATANPTEGGTVTGAGEYIEGVEVTLVATPKYGYNFVNWTKGEEVVSEIVEYTFTPSANVELVANFQKQDFTGNVIYVEPGKGTLKEAVENAGAGDKLVLKDGTYELGYISGGLLLNKEGLIITAAENAKPVILYTDAGACLQVEASTTFEGITFDGGAETQASFLITTYGVEVEDIVVYNCEFKNYSKFAISDQWSKGCHIGSLKIESCMFHDGGEAVVFSKTGLNDKHPCDYFEMKNSTAYNIIAPGEYKSVIHICSLADATGAQNKVVIDHVTIWNYDLTNGNAAIEVRKTNDLTITNCIIGNPEARKAATYLYGGSISNMIHFNASLDSDSENTYCWTDDPLFVDAANNNFMLQLASPAIGKATDGTNLGDPRWGVEAIVIGEGDNSAALATEGEVFVQVNREFIAGNLYTIALPFTLNDVASVFGQGTVLYEYDKLIEQNDEVVLHFNDKGTSIVAGKPYLILPAQDVDGFTVNKVTLSNSTQTLSFTAGTTTIAMEPILSVTTGQTTNGKYWLAADKYLYNNTNALPSLRALFIITTQNGIAPRARVALGENEATGLDNITTNEKATKAIVNGQLVIIRGGEMYNVQGQKL